MCLCVLQLCDIDNVRVIRTCCYVGNLAGNLFILIADRDSSGFGYPGFPGFCRFFARRRIVALYTFICGSYRTFTDSYTTILCDFCVMANLYDSCFINSLCFVRRTDNDIIIFTVDSMVITKNNITLTVLYLVLSTDDISILNIFGCVIEAFQIV